MGPDIENGRVYVFDNDGRWDTYIPEPETIFVDNHTTPIHFTFDTPAITLQTNYTIDTTDCSGIWGQAVADEEARSPIRIAFSIYNTDDEIENASDEIEPSEELLEALDEYSKGEIDDGKEAQN